MDEIAGRLRRYSRGLDWRVLWPTLREPDYRRARPLVQDAVKRVLRGERAILDGDDLSYAVGIAAFTNGVAALLAQWIEQGRVSASPAVSATLAPHLDHLRRRAERIRLAVSPAFDALLARGITPVVMKGFHTAYAYHDEPGVRPVADVDIQVPPSREADAEAALREAEFSFLRRPEAGKSEWIRRDVESRVYSVERTDARSRWQLELHTTFDRDFAGVFFARLDAFSTCVKPLKIGEQTLLAPDHPLLLLVLACQLSSELNSIRLMRLVDLVKVVRTDVARGSLDWDAVGRSMQRVGPRFCFPALALAEHLAPSTIDARTLELARSDASWALRREIDGLEPAAGFARPKSIVQGLMWAENPTQVIAGAAAAVRRRITRWMRQS